MSNNELLQIKAETSVLVTEILPIGVKFRLNNFLKRVNQLCEPVFEARNQLILELEPTGNILPTLEDGTANPKLAEFNSKFAEILKENVGEELVLPTVTLNELGELKTANNYPILFNLIIKE